MEIVATKDQRQHLCIMITEGRVITENETVTDQDKIDTTTIVTTVIGMTEMWIEDAHTIVDTLQKGSGGDRPPGDFRCNMIRDKEMIQSKSVFTQHYNTLDL